MGTARRFVKLRLTRIRATEQDVLANSRVEQKDVLLHNADVPPQILHLDPHDVLAIQADMALLRFVEAGDQGGQARLACARFAHQCNGLPGRHPERDVFKHPGG